MPKQNKKPPPPQITHYSAITEFEVVEPLLVDRETVGQKLKLRTSGEFGPDDQRSGYSLIWLATQPQHYRISKIVHKNRSYVIPPGYKPSRCNTHTPI
jgi:hypothetical protein